MWLRFEPQMARLETDPTAQSRRVRQNAGSGRCCHPMRSSPAVWRRRLHGPMPRRRRSGALPVPLRAIRAIRGSKAWPLRSSGQKCPRSPQASRGPPEVASDLQHTRAPSDRGWRFLGTPKDTSGLHRARQARSTSKLSDTVAWRGGCESSIRDKQSCSL